MAGRRPLIDEDGEPARYEIELVQQDPSQTKAYWNRALDRRRFEIKHDPTGDFRPGAKFSSEDFWSCHIPAYSHQVRPCWPPGLVVWDQEKKKTYHVTDDLHMEIMQ